MDTSALLFLAAHCCKNGRENIALDILRKAAECEDFNDCFTKCLAPALPIASSGEMVADGGNEGSGVDGLDNYSGYVDDMPNRSAMVGGVPASENTLNPSLHGNDSVAFGQVLSIASAVFAQKQFLHDGDELIVDPQLGAFASDALDAYDDEALVRVNVEKTGTLKPGRITIKL